MFTYVLDLSEWQYNSPTGSLWLFRLAILTPKLKLFTVFNTIKWLLSISQVFIILEWGMRMLLYSKLKILWINFVKIGVWIWELLASDMSEVRWPSCKPSCGVVGHVYSFLFVGSALQRVPCLQFRNKLTLEEIFR